jgi:hypothetical protein
MSLMKKTLAGIVISMASLFGGCTGIYGVSHVEGEVLYKVKTDEQKRDFNVFNAALFGVVSETIMYGIENRPSEYLVYCRSDKSFGISAGGIEKEVFDKTESGDWIIYSKDRKFFKEVLDLSRTINREVGEKIRLEDGNSIRK